MTEKEKAQFNKMLLCLKSIAKHYETPSKLRKNSKDHLGIDYEEALEMAYENIQNDAREASKNIKVVL